MNRNYIYDSISEALPELLDDLLRDGDEVGSRVGRTKEFTHVGITLRDPVSRELVLPDRKHNIAAQIAETMWVLSGRNDVDWLSHYLPRAKDFSDNGTTWRAAYGPRLRRWNSARPVVIAGGNGGVGISVGVARGSGYAPLDVDQWRECVRILDASSSSRQAVMSIWDPQQDYKPSKDIPCNNWLNFSSRLGKLDLHVAVRSNDVMWGWSGINVFEWSALLEVTAGILGLDVGSLHFSTTSFHLYDRHWEKAARIAPHNVSNLVYTPREKFDLSEWTGAASTTMGRFEAFDELCRQWFAIEEMIRTGAIVDDTEIETFSEPMLRSWLRVLAWWWTGDQKWIQPLNGSQLGHSCTFSVQPPARNESESKQDFVDFVDELHQQKHAAYGNSWKRRGEMLGIMANIARKMDRLESGRATDDETALDTAIDLMVYLAKYRWWLSDEAGSPFPLAVPATPNGIFSDYTEPVRDLLRMIHDAPSSEFPSTETATQYLIKSFGLLEDDVFNQRPSRYIRVNSMLADAYALAYQLFWSQ